MSDYLKELFINQVKNLGKSGASSWDDLGMKNEVMTIVPEQVVKDFLVDGPVFYATIADYSLEIGKTYSVKFNGAVYELECYSDNGNSTLGAKPYGNYTDYPFSIVNWGSNLTLLRGTNDPVTIAIHEEREVVVPIDYKFTPEGYPKAKTEVVEVSPEQSVTNTLTMYDGTVYSGNLNYLELKAGHTYKIVINGREYIETALEDESTVYIGDNSNTPYYKVPFYANDRHQGYIQFRWNATEGETINLAIYEVIETVTPMDVKFLPIEELKQALGLA